VRQHADRVERDHPAAPPHLPPLLIKKRVLRIQRKAVPG
jgi:type III restriction enzyme